MRFPVGIATALLLLNCLQVSAAERGPVAHWQLAGDANDSSGHGLHGVNHGVDLQTGAFDGRAGYIEIPDSPLLHVGNGDFSIAAWVQAGDGLDDVAGDVISKFDPELRRGFHLTLASSGAGYNSIGSDRHVQFSLDDGGDGRWHECGRPGGVTHNSDALTVFDGHLYAGVTDAPREADWAHVYRYLGEDRWHDCGRLGTGKTRGVYAMVVHEGSLYAATSSSHGLQPATMDFGRVYRYRADDDWEDLGQPGANYRLNSLASYRGRLYVCGFNIGTVPGYCYVYEGGQTWRVCGEFDGWPHAMTVHDGKLYAAYPRGEVFAYDGETWDRLGNPFGSMEQCSQIHSLGVYRGELFAGTWPFGRVALLRDGQWIDAGRPGDATEVIGLAVYNGSFYAGTIPRAEVFRYGGGEQWNSVRRLFDPPDFQPVPVGSGDKRVEDWSRDTSLTVFGGKLFVSTGTCYRTMIGEPLEDEIRGKVFAWETGAAASYDRDLGAGWKHLAAVRNGQRLALYVDGRQVAGAEQNAAELDASSAAPLHIGFGELDYFSGKIRDVRIYGRALADKEVQAIIEEKP